MTQTPQLPPNPPPEPLDAAEREVARALRNLPSASPPPELDARILGAARRAVHLAQPRKLHWGRSIGIGTAASALLAVGLFVKMHQAGLGMQVPTPAPESANETAAPATATQQAGSAAADAFARQREIPPSPSMAIKSMSPPRALPAPVVAQPMEETTAAPTPMPMPAAAAPPPPPAESVDVGSLAAKPAANAFPAAPQPERGRAQAAGAIEPPPPPPPPSAPAIVQDEPMQAIAPAPPVAAHAPESKVDAYTAPPRDEQNQPATAAAAATTTEGKGELDKDALQAMKKSAPAAGGSANPTGAVDATDAAKAKNLDSITVTGTRVRRVDTETASPVLILDRKSLSVLPVEDDSRLPPEPWLERIRQRLKAGDEVHARKSLLRFHSRYPDEVVPDDLQPLLR